jgi:hypothetical protein
MAVDPAMTQCGLLVSSSSPAADSEGSGPRIVVDCAEYGLAGGRASCVSCCGDLSTFCPRNFVCFCGHAFSVEAIDFPKDSGSDQVFVSLLIPSSVERFSESCFYKCEALLSVAFETGSKLSRIDSCAFGNCSSFSSLCIPSSVEVLGDSCFTFCRALSSVTFESGSKLSCIEPFAFCYCSSLSSICIPSTVELFCEEFPWMSEGFECDIRIGFKTFAY